MKDSVRKEIEELIKPSHNNFLNNEKESCLVEEFRDKVDWCYLSHYKVLSEDFISEFQNEIYWPNVSAFQRLSESFIREFRDRVDWHYISEYQDFSLDFILEFEDKIDIRYLIGKGFSMEEYKKYKEKYKINDRFEILDL